MAGTRWANKGDFDDLFPIRSFGPASGVPVCMARSGLYR